MSDHKAIREALAAGVTGATEDHLTIWMKVGNTVMLNSGRPVWARIADCAHEPNAAFIAACNPAAIRALLADLDAMRGALTEVCSLDPHESSTTEWNAALRKCDAAHQPAKEPSK